MKNIFKPTVIFFVLLSIIFTCCKKEEINEELVSSFDGITWKTHIVTDDGVAIFTFDIVGDYADTLPLGVLFRDSTMIDNANILPYHRVQQYNLSNNNVFYFTYLLIRKDTIARYMCQDFFIIDYDDLKPIYKSNSDNKKIER